MARKFLVFLLGALCLLPAYAVAAPTVIDIREHTRSNAAFRSLLLPGWGQAFNGETAKGYAIGGLFAASALTTYFFYNRAENTYNDYKTLGSADSSLYSDYQTQSNQVLVASIVTAGIWLIGIGDAYLNGWAAQGSAMKQSEGITLSCLPGECGLRYSKRF